MFIAYCWQSGLIEFQGELKPVPDGAIELGRGGPTFVETVKTRSRHSRNKPTRYIVPGVPEAPTGDAKLAALVAWEEWASLDEIEEVAA